jgi:amidohydrolase
MELSERIQGLQEEAVAIRRDLHCHPELGFHEVRTAGIVADFLRQQGAQVRTQVGGTGVVGTVKGISPGKSVMVRADMDALPISEETGADYASRVPGVMHACGHDAHTTIALMAAKILAEERDCFKGSVSFVFQPAEEGLGGARAMLEDGLLELTRPDCALALHVWEEAEVGQAGITAGPVLASSDGFRVEFSGQGGHGAKPHLSDDVITAASHFVTALHTVVARNVDPIDTAVVSVGRFNAGNAANVLPPTAELSGTVRTYLAPVRERVLTRIRELGEGIASAFGIGFDCQINDGTPAVVNDRDVTAAVQQTATAILGEGNVITDVRIMASEDMALVLQQVPGCYVFLGVCGKGDATQHPVHHPGFDIDERALLVGTELLARSALRCLDLPSA